MPSATRTLVFTDVVGSTELRVALGDDDADALRAEHDALLTTAAARHGGLVVKGLGDGLMLVFESSTDAVAGAIAMQQSVHSRNRRQGGASPLSIRVGLSAGDVSWGDGDYFGTPVVEAARLCALAEGGQILAADIVRSLVGSRGGHRFTALGAKELKGLAEPVVVAQVDWFPAVDQLMLTQWPLPSPLEFDVVFGFAGRDRETEVIDAAWKAALTGGRRAVLLSGEPGVGKTRLAAEVACRARDAGAFVVYGRCDDELGVSYQPFVEALRFIVSSAPPAQLGQLLGEFPEELVRLAPELSPLLPDLPPPMQSDAEAQRYRLFEAMQSCLTAVALMRPTILVLDDLHWATKPTLLLLRHILRAAGPLPLLIIGTYRDTELARTHPLAELLGDLRRGTNVERVAIGGLSADDVRSMMETAAGYSLRGREIELATAVHRETEGNPFFVGEVLRHLAESGRIVERDGRWTFDAVIAELGIPEGVREAVGRRLSHLSESHNTVLSRASVIGPEFDLVVLSKLVDLDTDTILDALDDATRAQLVREVASDRWRFTHALVRATLYDEISLSRRVRLHRLAGDALETTTVTDELLPALAHHFTQAAPLDGGARGIDYSSRAGARALERYANEEAATYYRQALDLMDQATSGDDERRCDLETSLGTALIRAGDPAHRSVLSRAARRAQQIGDDHRLALAVLVGTRGGTSAAGALDPERIEVFEVALAVVGPDQPALRARLLAGLAAEIMFEGQTQRREQLVDEALSLARDDADPHVLAEVLTLAISSLGGIRSNRALAPLVTELTDIAVSLADPMTRGMAVMARITGAMGAGRRDLFDAGLDEIEGLGQTYRDPNVQWWSFALHALLHLIDGEFDKAEESAQQALEIGTRTGNALATLSYGGTLFWARFHQDRLPEILEFLPSTSPMPAFAATVACGYAMVGRLDDARQILEPIEAVGLDRFPRDQGWLAGLLDLAIVYSRLKDEGRAAELLEVLAQTDDQLVGVPGSWLGPVDYYRGLLAETTRDLPNAEHYLRRAIEVTENFREVPFLARCRLTLARVLRELDPHVHRDEILALATAALDTATRIGMPQVARESEDLLATAIRSEGVGEFAE